MSGTRIEQIETSDGPLELAVAGKATAARPTLVLVHGIQGTRSVWDSVMLELSRDWRVVGPNLRGRGRSFVAGDPGCYSMEHFAEDLASVLDAIKGKVVLVGWSMGGLVALDFVQRRGLDRIAGLALVSTSACLKAEGLEPAIWFRGGTPEALTAEARERALRLKLTDTAEDMAVAGAWLSASQVDYRAVLSRIDVPTLVLHGLDDTECPPDHGRALAAAITTARLDLLPGCGHVPMAEKPEAFAQTLAAFAVGCEAASLS
ncbi:alpha/beta fold hydrolase [Roseibaca sp. Y0-43]|jgi:pimeloyl-ACP methyl ester carboxylesterase|uniref:alpha/beta fold hydrolase n=1 Tax=Roseibaca sp. Y0-43 TaxID=2816854 RepID=UPI001D0C77A7|nr:alpha/beta fold hydrolase [Roseibaca sp. Y0-43]MCC1482785.1 alpha/beta fold hydrolase [Roseibaca sp. Y0-43]